MIKYNITPVPKPRMTQSDKWKKRPCVLRYWSFKDEVRRHGIGLQHHGSHVTFVLPMPKSWSNKKRAEMYGQPHQSKPDLDNLKKALLDAIFDDDKVVWDMWVTKIWGRIGEIWVEDMAQNQF